MNATGRSAQFIRVTATRLAVRQDDYMFALAELTALTPRGANVALGTVVSAADSVEAPVRWQKKNLTDGWYPGGDGRAGAQLAELQEQRDKLIAIATSPAEKILLAQLDSELASVRRDLEKLPAPRTAYVASVYTGSGAFAGTGATGWKPRPILSSTGAMF